MSNVVKPTIPVEVADAIEALRNIPFYSNRDIINAYYADPGRRDLRAIPFDTLLAALVNGYERELTEEQRMARIKRELTSDYITHRSGMGRYGNAYEDGAYADGIESALDAVGIKIVGVNA